MALPALLVTRRRLRSARRPTGAPRLRRAVGVGTRSLFLLWLFIILEVDAVCLCALQSPTHGWAGVNATAGGVQQSVQGVCHGGRLHKARGQRRRWRVGGDDSSRRRTAASAGAGTAGVTSGKLASARLASTTARTVRLATRRHWTWRRQPAGTSILRRLVRASALWLLCLLFASYLVRVDAFTSSPPAVLLHACRACSRSFKLSSGLRRHYMQDHQGFPFWEDSATPPREQEPVSVAEASAASTQRQDAGQPSFPDAAGAPESSPMSDGGNDVGRSGLAPDK